MQIDIQDKNGKKIIMKIKGSLVGILLEIDENKCKDFIILQKREITLHENA